MLHEQAREDRSKDFFHASVLLLCTVHQHPHTKQDRPQIGNKRGLEDKSESYCCCNVQYTVCIVVQEPVHRWCKSTVARMKPFFYFFSLCLAADEDENLG